MGIFGHFWDSRAFFGIFMVFKGIFFLGFSPSHSIQWSFSPGMFREEANYRTRQIIIGAKGCSRLLESLEAWVCVGLEGRLFVCLRCLSTFATWRRRVKDLQDVTVTKCGEKLAKIEGKDYFFLSHFPRLYSWSKKFSVIRHQEIDEFWRWKGPSDVTLG